MMGLDIEHKDFDSIDSEDRESVTSLLSHEGEDPEKAVTRLKQTKTQKRWTYAFACSLMSNVIFLLAFIWLLAKPKPEIPPQIFCMYTTFLSDIE